MYFVYMGEVMKMLYQYPFDYRRGISMDPAMCCVNLYGHDYRLTQQEYLLFDELLKSALTSCSRGQPVRAMSRGELLRTAWGSASDYETRTVDVHVQRLRAKLGGEYEHLIGTVRNVGYRFDPPEGEGDKSLAAPTASDDTDANAQ